ncbi:duplicated homeodomain-like superfamily protein [Actinidia rufa]|uniref:Duplicated homeodomain-like superfamily protein n=1 Tax=Actinidia rufa TaxID=165716 RepID=A0A7J0GVB7_9ERIC|nr:duplicated homeodomain-like superfamily protein [Actinidia rufa]
MDKFAIFGKDFRMAASFLDHKTTADCIEFYYRNHKSDWFVKIKKKPELPGQGKLCSTNNYLVTSGKRWNLEMNASSLDMLGAAIAVNNADDGRQSQQKMMLKMGLVRMRVVGRWILLTGTDEEKFIFIQAVSSYGIDFTMISRPGDEEMHASENVNGSGVDNEDACVVKTSSVICSEISGLTGTAWTKTMGQEELVVKDPERQSENMVTYDRQSDGKPELHFDGDSKRVEEMKLLWRALLLENHYMPEEADGQSGSGKLLILMKIQILAFAEHSNLAEDLPGVKSPTRTPSTDTLSTLGLEKISDECQISACADDHSLHQSGDTVLGHAISCQILGGYPLRLSTKKEECFLQKCNNSQTQSSVAELPFLSQEQKTDHSQPPPFSSSEIPKNHVGMVIGNCLWGQMTPLALSYLHPCKGVQHPKLSSKTFNLKFKGSVSGDGNSVPPKLDHINYLGLENLPMRSYGYWDGTRIRTVFLVYRTLLSYWQNILLHSATTIPHLTRSSSSRIQLRNEFEAVSNIPQAAKCMVGINVVGRGVILVGACTGVSEPLAAIKMHYAKAEQYGVQTTSVIREDESWRGKGDLGRWKCVEGPLEVGPPR